MTSAPRIHAALFACAAWGYAGAAAADQDKLVRYGEHLSQDCTTCHRREGGDNGIPSIVGMKSDDFGETLKLYRNGSRDNPAMVSFAQSLGEDEGKALPAVVAALPPPGKAGAPAGAK